jgi:MtN3 and saliva related transmembrane protein
MTGDLWTLLGLAAGVCTTGCFVPQVLKIWRDGDSEAISQRMYAVSVAAFSLWAVHGFMIGSAPVVIFNALNVVLTGTILVLKLRGRNGTAARPVEGRA